MTKRWARGPLVMIEGPDGVGKTSASTRLALILMEQGHEVLLTSEPSDGTIGTYLRGLLANKDLAALPPGPALQALFLADRIDHTITVIEPALAAGKIVVCDRFDLSTIAYLLALEPPYRCSVVGCPWTGTQRPPQTAQVARVKGLPEALVHHHPVIDQRPGLIELGAAWHAMLPAPDIAVILSAPVDVLRARRIQRLQAASDPAAAPDAIEQRDDVLERAANFYATAMDHPALAVRYRRTRWRVMDTSEGIEPVTTAIAAFAVDALRGFEAAHPPPSPDRDPSIPLPTTPLPTTPTTPTTTPPSTTPTTTTPTTQPITPPATTTPGTAPPGTAPTTPPGPTTPPRTPEEPPRPDEPPRPPVEEPLPPDPGPKPPPPSPGPLTPPAPEPEPEVPYQPPNPSWLRNYIGASGLKTPIEVAAILAAAGKMPDHSIMLGVLMSDKTRRGLANSYPLRYPPRAVVPTLWSQDPRALNLLHYATEDLTSLHEQLADVTSLAGPLCHGIQLNIPWPPIGDVRWLREHTRLFRRVLQVGPQAMTMCGKSPSAIVKRIFPYIPFITDVLLDCSGGKGLPLNLPLVKQVIAGLAAKAPRLLVGVAGGLGPERVLELLDFPGMPLVSMDAESGIRRAGDDAFDVVALAGYLRGAKTVWRVTEG